MTTDLNQDPEAAAELPITVDLGEIGLSCETLIKLRPGSVVTVPHSSALRGRLRLGDARIAEIRIAICASKLVLEIEEIVAGLPSTANSCALSNSRGEIDSAVTVQETSG